MTKTITIAGLGARRLHFNSWMARALKPGGINNCFSPNATDIYISRDWIQGPHLAHEWGHGEQARRKGWRYLPWVVTCYLTQGYAKSDPERDADAYMEAYKHLFPVWITP